MLRQIRCSILAKLIPAFGMMIRNRIVQSGWRFRNGVTTVVRASHATRTHNESTGEVRNRLRGLLRSGRSIVLLSALVTAAIGATAGFTIWHNRLSALEEHRHETNSMGIVLAEQTSRYVQVVDLILREVQSRIATLNVATPADFEHQLGTPEVHTYLAERLKNVPQVDAIILIDANGVTLNWSRAWPVIPVGAVGRDFYNYFKEHNDPGLFIGSVSKGRSTGKLSLFFARRVSGLDGRFLGLALGIVDVRYLIDFYQTAGEHENESVTLLRRDGTMLIRYPNPEAAVGVKLPQKSPWYAMVAEGGGSYFNPGIGDGIPSLISVHPLRDYPLVVDVLTVEAEVFAQWKRQAVFIVGFALAAALAFSGLFWMLARQFRWQTEQNARLEEAAICLHEGQQALRAYAEMSVDWFWEQDADFRFKKKTIIPSMVASDDTGKTRWELAGSAMSEERWVPHKADLAARRPFRNFSFERIGPDGARRFMILNGDPVFDRNGTFSGYRGTGREITAEVEAKGRLAQANAELELGRRQFDAVLSNVSQGVCFFDGEKRLLLWNRRYTDIYNLPPEAIHVGCSLAEIVGYRESAGTGPDTSASDYLGWQDQLAATKQPSSTVVALKNDRFVAICYQPMSDGGWVATHEDVTERQRAEASVVFMARHDALTKLPNRVLFRECMEQAIAMAGRGTEFSVMCLDLDNFKQVNDTMGHPVGDGLLVAVADRLSACVREVDTVARLGGDEFAIIQLGVRQPDDAEVLAARIVAAFLRPFEVGGHQVMTGVSIGVAVAPGDGASYETLMRDADVALYLAKTEGGGRVRFFEPEMDTRIHIRRLLELDLQGAIIRHEFELYYQPLVSLITNKISGFEALLRWNHPVRGLVSPMDFIPVAEETGMIVAIGEWVLHTACFEAENWPAEISVAVNLSPVQFEKGDLVGTVQAALAASGLRPNRLDLEITESVFLRDTVDTLAILHQLRAMGIGVALDDFGTGYSSLSYLRSFPFSKIKIDQSFVRDLMTNKESVSIVRAVTGLGKSLGIKTIAEGVETLDQLNRLRDKGCTEVQGYLFSPPVPAIEIPALIEKLQQLGQGANSVKIMPMNALGSDDDVSRKA
jgi:diguanylate cyclase (GGDEF)-like protein